MLFNWISRCWGGMGVNTKFEKARLNCSITDWTAPLEDDILTIITTFQDKNPQIPAKTAITIFLSHLERDEQRAHPAFLLKHLYLLDHCVQQMTALDTIGYYYNSNLTNPKSSKNLQGPSAHSPLNQLINSYYSYIKTKARHYTHYQNTFFKKQFSILQKSFQPLTTAQNNVTIYDDKPSSSQKLDTKSMQSSMLNSRKKKKQCTQQQKLLYNLFAKQRQIHSFTSIFKIIQQCQQIQKLILQINKSYINGNKKVELIQYIYTMILKTFIRCYIIVSVGIRYLFKEFMNMNYQELQKFIKSFQYFNGDYTTEFIKFVQTNKNEINIFKQINYTELTFLSKDNMRILLEYQKEFKQKEELKRKNSINSNVSPIKPLNFLENQQIQDRKVIQLPQEVQFIIKENMKIFYKPRKNMDYCLETFSKKQIQDPITYKDNISSQDIAQVFFTYENTYHNDFNLIPESVDHLQSSNHKSAVSSGKRQRSNNKQQKQAAQASNRMKLELQVQNLHLHHAKSVDGKNKAYKFTQSKLIQPVDKSQIKVQQSPKKMLQIKQMFSLQQKQAKSNQKWQQWQNIYAHDAVAMKN